MGTFTRIDSYSLRNLNNAEYANFIDRFLALLPLADKPDDPENPDVLSLQSDTPAQGAPSLAIPAETVEQERALLEKLTDLNRETRSSAQTEQIAEAERGRDEVATFIIKHISGSSHTTLHFVTNHQNSFFIAKFADPFHKFLCSQIDAAFSLKRLQDNRTCFVCYQCFYTVQIIIFCK